MYPCVFIYILEKMGRRLELLSYLDRCYRLEQGDPASYWMYVHGFWLTYLQKERAKGKMKHGKLLWV